MERAIVVANGYGCRNFIEDTFADRLACNVVARHYHTRDNGGNRHGNKQALAHELAPPDGQVWNGRALKIHHGKTESRTGLSHCSIVVCCTLGSPRSSRRSSPNVEHDSATASCLWMLSKLTWRASTNAASGWLAKTSCA